jgi:SpoVK/Ycf46/Vps4 family AAA+-type ATPase
VAASRQRHQRATHEIGWLGILLQQLSEPSARNVLFVGTTSRLMMVIDSAFTRPGRVESLIYFGRTSAQERLEILLACLREARLLTASLERERVVAGGGHLGDRRSRMTRGRNGVYEPTALQSDKGPSDRAIRRALHDRLMSWPATTTIKTIRATSTAVTLGSAAAGGASDSWPAISWS